MPAASLQRLKDGNERFVAGRLTRVPCEPAQLRRTPTIQRPFAAVLACSDARVPVEFVFDQGLGDLFVVRTAGNTAGGHEVASLAFAVNALRTPIVVVLGHTDCGAVRAAVCPDHAIDELAPITDEIRPAALRVCGLGQSRPDQPTLDAVSRSHVGDVIDLLIGRSPVIADAVARGACRVVGALYETHSGRVDFMDHAPPRGPSPEVVTRAAGHHARTTA